jgi:uncharacterized membrane protein (UPF0127 family)
MDTLIVHNQTRPLTSPIQARYCASYLCRLRGLTFRRSLAPDEGLLLVQQKESRLDTAIHMLGVFMDLTVVWISAAREVVDVRLARRWRLAYVPKAPALYVLELAGERYEEFQPGDRLRFEKPNLD